MRVFLKFLMFGAVLAAALFVYAFQVEPKQLQFRNHVIGTGDSVVRIALVSDLHLGGIHVPSSRVQMIVERINNSNVDLTLMPGDFINGHEPRLEMNPDDISVIEDGLFRFGALNSQAVATLGNHDNWHDAVSVRTSLEASNVIVLNNEARLFGNLCLVGLADSDTASPTSDTFKSCGAEHGIIALMHSPDARSLLPSHVLLAVAGHTHGGQVNLPFFGRAVTSTDCGKPCAYGLVQKTPPLLVTSGIGTSILPIRFRSPPEIVFIELRY